MLFIFIFINLISPIFFNYFFLNMGGWVGMGDKTIYRATISLSLLKTLSVTLKNSQQQQQQIPVILVNP